MDTQRRYKNILSLLAVFVTVLVAIGGWYLGRSWLKTKFSQRKFTEIVETQNVNCGGRAYFFDIVRVGVESPVDDYSYFTDVYRGIRSTENFIVRLKPVRGGNLGVFSVITKPKFNCNRVFLTTRILETDAPSKGIFVWEVDTKDIRELVVSEEFNSAGLPSREDHWVSPGGDKVIIAQQIKPTAQNSWCDYRALRLIFLQEDRAESFVLLRETESLDNGYSELSPYCEGLNFGWSDESTIYYDVYDATVEGIRSLKERRILKIE